MYLANMGGAKILNSKTFHIFSLGLQLTVDLLNILVIIQVFIRKFVNWIEIRI